MHLRYDVYGAGLDNEFTHPQQMMASLGITYEEAKPDSMGTQWWFMDCDHLPAVLPPWIEKFETIPNSTTRAKAQKGTT